MLDILEIAQQRLSRGGSPLACAVATIVSVEGSVPRPVGTSMLVDAEGSIHGSLSGGCVEGAVLEACQEALETGASALHRFGVSEDDAFAVGLMCGGSLEVLVQPFEPGDADRSPLPHPAQMTAGAAAEEPAAIVMRLPARAPRHPVGAAAGGQPTDGLTTDGQTTDGTVPVGSASVGSEVPGVAVIADRDEVASALAPLVPHQALDAATSQAATMIRSGRTGTIRLAPPDGRGEPIELFIESRTRPAHLVVFGANAFGQALVAAARPLDLRITLCDQRPAFADPASFPGAEVVRAWPHRFLAEASGRGDLDERSMICVLTHDPKVDVPALSAALEIGAAYVGAMGSRRSDRDRRAALREAGVSPEAMARLRSPIGLDLGAVTPAEVAVAILAEILAVRANRSAVEPLRDGEGPLHPSAG